MTVFELSHYIKGHRRTYGPTDRRTDRQTDAADDNTPSGLIGRGVNTNYRNGFLDPKIGRTSVITFQSPIMATILDFAS